MKISIITVTYNCGEALKKTLKSVENQTDKSEFEYIVVDGGSTDETVEIIAEAFDKGLVTKWISEKDKGIYDAMNKGAAMASGEWINFLNAGDSFAAKDVVSKVVKKLNATTAQIVYADHILELPYGNYIFRASNTVEGLEKGMIFCHQAVFVDAKLMQSKGFDLAYNISGDYNFFFQSYRAGVQFEHLDLVVVRYEAVDGVSAKNRLKAIRQNAHIQGVDQTMRWKISFAIQSVKHHIKAYISNLVPNYSLRAKRRGLEKQQNIDKIEIE